jgi:hemolysin activation/secretion protein
LQIALKESEVADQIDARIVVKESQPWNFATSLANTGAKRHRTRPADHCRAGTPTCSTWTTSSSGPTPRRSSAPSDVRQLGLNYRIPLYRAGRRRGASYTRSSVVGNYGAFTSTGAGQTMGLNYSHYLPPDGGYRSYVTLALDDKRFDITEISGTGARASRSGAADR